MMSEFWSMYETAVNIYPNWAQHRKLTHCAAEGLSEQSVYLLVGIEK